MGRLVRLFARLLVRLVGGTLLAVYYVVTRAIIAVLAIYLTAYFLIGSGPVKSAIHDLVAEALPGGMTFATLQWGPVPWHLRLADVRVHGTRGEEVIRVRAIEASINWGQTASGLWGFLRDPDTRPLRVLFDRVELLDPWARIEVDDDSLIGIQRAFNLGEDDVPTSGETSVELDMRVSVVRVINGGALVESPGFRLEASGTHAVTDFALLRDGAYIRFDIPRTTIDRVVMSFTSFSHLPEPFVIEATDIVVDDFAWRALGFTWRNASGVLPGGRFEGEGGLDADDPATPWFGSGRVELDSTSPITQTLIRGQLEGPLTIAIAGYGDAEQVRASWTIESPGVAVAGRVIDNLWAQGRVEPRGTPLEPRLHAIFVDAASVTVAGGQIGVEALAWEPYRPTPGLGDGPRDLWASMSFVGISPLELLGNLVPGVPSDATATGRLHIAHWQHVRDDRLEVALEPSTLTFEQAPIPGLGTRWVAEGLIRHITGLRNLQNPDDPDVSKTAHLPTREILELVGLQVDAADARARLAGHIDFAAKTLDVEPYLRLGTIAPVARGLMNNNAIPTADLPAGRLVVKAARLFGPLSNPRLDATINWTNARLGGRDLGQVSGSLSLVDGVISTTDLQTRTPLPSVGVPTTDGSPPRKTPVGRFSIDGRLSLFAPQPAGGGLTMPALLTQKPFQVRVKNVEGLLAVAVTTAFGPDARIAVDQAQFEGLADDLVPSLRGRGRVRVTNATLGDESKVRLEGLVDLEPNLGLSVRDARMTLASGSLWSGSLRIGPEVSRPRSGPPTGFESRSLEAQLEISNTSLSELETLAKNAPDVEGNVSGVLSLGGTLGRPSVIGTLAIDKARYGHIELGSARLSVTTNSVPASPGTAARRQIELSAFDADFFPGYSLERAQLVLDGATPRRVEVTVRAKDRDLGDFVAGIGETVDVVGSASAELDLDLATGLAAIRLRALPGELSFLIPERRARWNNQTELLLVSDGRRFTLHPVTLFPSAAPRPGRTPAATGAGQPADQTIDVCGRFDPATLTIDAQLAANLDLALAPGLADAFSVTRGRFSTRPDPIAAAAVGDNTCLQNIDDFIHVGGPITSPVVVGRLETSGLVLVPRGSGRELRIKDGSAILLRQGRSVNQQRVELGLGQDRFEGELDDGSFGLTGTVELSNFQPQSLDLRVSGADIFLQSPGEFAITASPFGRIVATDLMGPLPSLSVTGDLSISEGRFSKSFDTFARAVGGALGVRADAYSTSVLDSIPWLGQTRLDVNIIANDFQIQTALPLARTDLRARLDLTLRGTISEPRLTRRIDILPGGTLSYFVFERTFIVNQGAIDFDGDPERPLVDVTAQTQITYLQRAQTALQEEDEKEVGITLRMTGRVPDLKIELTSDDASFDQADIQSLLITGKPRGDLDRAQESQLVSADLANVINSVFAAPFVRRASVGVDQKGGLEYRVGTCFAPGLCFDTTTVSDDTETTLRAKFSLAIGDDVVCEGTLRRSDGAATSTQDTYQARCRYRIPLE